MASLLSVSRSLERLCAVAERCERAVDCSYYLEMRCYRQFRVDCKGAHRIVFNGKQIRVKSHNTLAYAQLGTTKVYLCA